MATKTEPAKPDAKPAGNGKPGMGGKTWNPLTRLAETGDRIDELGLGEHIVELDRVGYTIVPPEKMGGVGWHEPLLQDVLRIAEEETGVRPDIETGETIGKGNSRLGLFPFQEELQDMIFKSREFEKLIVHPTIMALVSYLLGEHAELSGGAGVWFRGPVPAPPEFIPPSLHSDNYGIPSPFPPYAQICNATIAITEYSRAGGCLGFVPGSHKLMRHPARTDEFIDQWVPAEAPAGSLIFWHGNTWHTIGNPRTIPGLRVSTSLVYCRPYILPIHAIKDVPQELIDRNPPQFARLMGLHNRYKVGDHLANAVGDLGISGAPSWWE